MRKQTTIVVTGALRVKMNIMPVHNKTYNKTCVTSIDSDQPVHPSSMAIVLVYPSLNGLEAVEGI